MLTRRDHVAADVALCAVGLLLAACVAIALYEHRQEITRAACAVRNEGESDGGYGGVRSLQKAARVTQRGQSVSAAVGFGPGKEGRVHRVQSMDLRRLFRAADQLDEQPRTQVVAAAGAAGRVTGGRDAGYCLCDGGLRVRTRYRSGVALTPARLVPVLHRHGSGHELPRAARRV